MKKMHKTAGFTLVEMLVVVSIIVVLMAIMFPVFQSVREKARQSNCQANLHQIAAAMKIYRTDNGRYPPAPYYDTSAKRYVGGVSALYPDEISDKNLLICPADRQVDGMEAEARERLYSSYNGWVEAPDPNDEETWKFKTGTFHSAQDPDEEVSGPERYYNCFGYTQEGVDAYYYTSQADNNLPYLTAAPTWLTSDGLRLRHYPRLRNRHAPDNTYITLCPHHREYANKAEDEVDIYVTVGGSRKVVNRHVMQEVSNGVSRYVTQRD